MAVKLSDLTTESDPASTDILLIADPTTGLAKKITVSALKNYMDGLGGGGDTTAPVIVTATANTANTIQVVFSESVTVTTAGWSFKINGANWAISSVSGSGNTWTFTMATSGSSTDTILRSYNSATGVTVDTAANELVTFTDQSVTNSIPAGGSFDTDAEAFFTASGISDNTQKTAVNSLVIAMKNANIWTKMIAVYPFVGGTASTHKWNLKNPLDTDAAFRLTFGGAPATFTHSSTGVTPDSASYSFGDTHVIPTTHLSANNFALGFSRRTTGTNSDNWYDMGLAIGSPSEVIAIYARNSDTLFSDSGNTTTNRISLTNSDGNAIYIQTRTANNVHKIFKNGVQQGSTDTDVSAASLPTNNIYFPGVNSVDGGGSSLQTGAEYTFGFISTGLDDTEVAALNTAISNYDTALSR